MINWWQLVIRCRESSWNVTMNSGRSSSLYIDYEYIRTKPFSLILWAVWNRVDKWIRLGRAESGNHGCCYVLPMVCEERVGVMIYIPNQVSMKYTQAHILAHVSRCGVCNIRKWRKSRYLDHESHQWKCDGKLVKVIIGKATQTCAGLTYEFMSCLLDWRLREPIGGSFLLMSDNRFLKSFSKICNFLINDLWLRIDMTMARYAFHWFIISLLSTLYSLLLLTLPLQMKRWDTPRTRLKGRHRSNTWKKINYKSGELWLYLF
jgi:hypothetical protein